ncbi:MAG: hypothetical protein JSW00_10180 [Thermoplasmata archaeon]|nr:MAG: hypothetical protein JSW00_10180 [Thermoplasmata archaeon]
MMKCEKCPFHGLEGVQNEMNWCKLYNAQSPVEGCEEERDTLIMQKELMQGFQDNKHHDEQQ